MDTSEQPTKQWFLVVAPFPCAVVSLLGLVFTFLGLLLFFVAGTKAEWVTVADGVIPDVRIEVDAARVADRVFLREDPPANPPGIAPTKFTSERAERAVSAATAETCPEP